jgi:transcriptional regulator with XRE-family HTH domain
LADRAGLDRTYISGIERGRENVTILNLCRLAEGLEVDPGELTAGLSQHPKVAGDQLTQGGAN